MLHLRSSTRKLKLTVNWRMVGKPSLTRLWKSCPSTGSNRDHFLDIRTDQELTAMVHFNDVLTALAARESQNAHQCESESLFHLIE